MCLYVWLCLHGCIFKYTKWKSTTTTIATETFCTSVFMDVSGIRHIHQNFVWLIENVKKPWLIIVFFLHKLTHVNTVMLYIKEMKINIKLSDVLLEYDMSHINTLNILIIVRFFELKCKRKFFAVQELV